METYKTTKAIRFKLEADAENIKDIQTKVKDLAEESKKFNLTSFVLDLNNFLDDLKTYLFNNKEGSLHFKKNLSIKNEWLKSNAKRAIAGKQLKRGQTVGDINNLSSDIEVAFDTVCAIYENLANNASLAENERARRAQTALLLKQLSSKRALPLLISFVENSMEKSETDDLSVRLKREGAKLNILLIAGLKAYLPEQSSGITITKASFNYYTINKNPVDFGREITMQKDKLVINITSLDDVIDELNTYYIRDKRYDNEKQAKQYLEKKILDTIKSDISNYLQSGKNLLLGDAPMLEIENCEYLRQILKNIKSKQKNVFDEYVKKQSNTKGYIPDVLYLFKDISEQDFNEYKLKTKKIEDKAAEINPLADKETKKTIKEDEKGQLKQLRSELKQLKVERGALINAADKTTEDSFKTYKAFAKFYGAVAQKHGKILTLLKGIEKERAESQTVNYWALILEENNRHKLVLIPRNTKEKKKSKECKEWLEKSQNNEGVTKAFWFESFTYRSLRKLCFGYVENKTQSNEFYENIAKELRGYTKNHKGDFFANEFDLSIDEINKIKGFEKDIEKERGKSEEFRDTSLIKKAEQEISSLRKTIEQKKIKFYQDVLSSNYAKQVLNLPFEQLKEDILSQSFDSLDDFSIALEAICYRREVRIQQGLEDKLRKDFDAQIFDISSIDLEHPAHVKDKSEQFAYKDKTHTQLWKHFWSERNSNGFDIRLNPEISISYREPKDSRVKKYGKGSALYDEKKKNRYLHPQFTLVTTISEHSLSLAKDMSFMSDEEFKNSVDSFNNKLKKEDIKFAIGIDNGIVELATLGIYLSEFNKPIDPEKHDALKNTTHKFTVLTITEKGLRFENGVHKDGIKKDKPYRPIDNPSYFLNKDQYKKTFGSDADFEINKAKIFAEQHLLTLDLTMAKVINGNIISNGDISSFLSLKLKEAQQRIYELNEHQQKETDKIVKIKQGNALDSEEKASCKDFNDKNDPFNFFAVVYDSCKISEVHKIFINRQWFGILKNQDTIQKELEEYNTKRTVSDEELTLKINCLKQSIVANAIGVIYFLYQKYKVELGGDGLIVKEGFDTDKVRSDLNQFRGNIYRMLEWALYKKFQNYGLTPPIKNLLSLRGNGINEKSTDAILRFGNVGFVSKQNTSQICPICKPDYKPSDVLDNKKMKLFICDKCGFNSKESNFHSNDGVASFNIAKRGFNNFMQE